MTRWWPVPDIITAVVGSRAAAAATGATSSTRAATIGQRDATATILASMSPITLVAPRLIYLTVRAHHIQATTASRAALQRPQTTSTNSRARAQSASAHLDFALKLVFLSQCLLLLAVRFPRLLIEAVIEPVAQIGPCDRTAGTAAVTPALDGRGAAILISCCADVACSHLASTTAYPPPPLCQSRTHCAAPQLTACPRRPGSRSVAAGCCPPRRHRG